MDDAKLWCGKALNSTLTMWSNMHHHGCRTSEHLGQFGTEYFPTATFHAIASFGTCGVWNTSLLRDLKLELESKPSSPEEILETLLKQRPKKEAAAVEMNGLGDWFEGVLGQSSHQTSGTTQSSSNTSSETINIKQPKRPSPREFLVLERLFRTLRILLPLIHPSILRENQANILAGMEKAGQRLRRIVSTDNGETLLTETELFQSHEFTPYVLLNIARCTEDWKLVLDYLGTQSDTCSTLSVDFEILQRYLADCFERHMERHMAHRTVHSDPVYDPTSLAFAVRGLSLLQPDVRNTGFFRSCIQAVVEGQNPDGCWPDGITVSYRESGEIIQQPSVEVALALATATLDSLVLVEHSSERIALLTSSLPALRKTASYLVATFNARSATAPGVSGWTSDRVRRRHISELWITAMAAQLFFYLWLGERALARSKTLAKLDVQVHKSPNTRIPDLEIQWLHSVIEPDEDIVRPASTLWTNVIEPITNQRVRGEVFRRPPKDAVSFILFGPPGSGKTYFVKQVARFLEWPLVELNPGHFIRNGLELIEATAREIFEDLMHLDHAVIFFDECDELFKDREAQMANNRNILSFATASMLPKLQNLHDARQVVFFLGTNYLSQVDRAIRRPGRFDDILLFDRPYEAARRTVIKKVFDGLSDQNLEALIKETSGFTIDEVLKYTRRMQLSPDGTYRADITKGSSVNDYVDWCIYNGEDELSASRLTREQKRNIKEEWNKVPGYREALYARPRVK